MLYERRAAFHFVFSFRTACVRGRVPGGKEKHAVFLCRDCSRYDRGHWRCSLSGRRRFPGDAAEECPCFRVELRSGVIDCGGEAAWFCGMRGSLREG
jgi:hypothetical protein